MEIQESGGKPAPQAIVVVGWIFAILGGLIGIILGAYIWKNKEYDVASQSKGKTILIVSCVMLVLWNIFRFI